MTLWVKNNGAWISPLACYIKDSGVWKRIYALWVKDSGTWKKVYPVAGSTTITTSTTWSVPAYETLIVECFGGGGGGGGGGANEGFSYGSWGGQGGFGGQTTFASATPVYAFGGIGGGGGGDLGQINADGNPGGGTYGSNIWGLCRPGAATAGASQGTVGGQSLYSPLGPGPTPSSITFSNGQIIANGGSAGGLYGTGSGNGGVRGGSGGAGGYTKIIFNVRDVGAPAPNSTISVTIGGGGGGGGGAYDSGARGQDGSVGVAGKTILTWS